MDQKAKIIIAVLAVIIVALFGVVMVSFDAKQKVEAERNQLSETAKSLKDQVNAAQQDKQRLDQQMKSMSQQLYDMQNEKADLDAKYSAAEKAKADLLEEIKKLKSQKPAPQAAMSVPAEFAPSSMSMGALSQGNDAYWAGVLKQKTDLELKMETIKVDLQSAKIAAEQAQREKAALQLEVNNVNREKEDLRRQLDYNQKMMDSVAQELVREKNDKIKISEQVKPLKNENIVLRRQLEALNSRKIELERKLSDVQVKNSELEGKFNEMDTFLKGKIGELDILKKQLTDGPVAQTATNPAPTSNAVELPPIVVRPAQPAVRNEARNPSLVGKVLATNPDSNFVVIDLGEDSGVGVGDLYQVIRDGQVIGSLEVMQVRKSISACDIKKQATPIRIGDTVK